MSWGKRGGEDNHFGLCGSLPLGGVGKNRDSPKRSDPPHWRSSHTYLHTYILSSGQIFRLIEKGLDKAIRLLASILNYGAEVDGYYNNMGVASKGAADVEGVFTMTSFWMRERGCVCREIWGRYLQIQLKACLHFDSNASHVKA